jgi:hypothetical protein
MYNPVAILLASACLTAALPAWASAEDELSLAEIGTGFTVGRIGGIGAMHRQFFKNGLGWSVGGIFLFTGFGWFLNAGAQGYYTLHKSEDQRLYLLGGASYLGNWDAPWAAGVGLGWTLGKVKGVAISFELPAVLQYFPSKRSFGQFDPDTGQNVSSSVPAYEIYPIPAMSLLFNY